MPNIFFQISGLLYITMILVVYIRKKKEITWDNYVFRSLVLCSMFGLILDISSALAAVYLEHHWIVPLLVKLSLWGLATWMIIFTFYLVLATSPKNTGNLLMDKSENSQYFFKLLRKTIIFNGIAVALISVLPINIVVEGSSFYSNGPSAIICYLYFAICFIIWITIIIKNRKNLKSKQFKPVFIFLFLACIAIVIQIVRPDMLIITSLMAFVTVVTYHSIENPDLYAIEALNIATQQAESANHAKSDFLSSMSHEIRTPLNAIVGFSQSLAKEDISGPARDEVKEILNASTGLLETINGILDISKLEANKIEIVKTDYSTRKLINEIATLANSRVGSKAVELKFEIDDKLPPVLYGDNLRIKQILTNLITNAIKYTKYGHVLFKIDSLNSKDKCMLTITVEDTGIGMTEEDLEMLFVKFQRFEIDKNINIAGTGLGMAITKGLVELMNGEISVTSEYGKGSTFTIVLEQEISDKEVKDTPDDNKITTIEPFNASGQRVLVVDDNKINLKVAERLIGEYQVDLDLSDSGRDCINKIMTGEKYDLILLDIMMPKMKGPEVLEALKKIPDFDTPVVALTADVISGMEEKYITQGFNDCLPKPIVEEELYYLLRKFLKETGERVAPAPKVEEEERDENGRLITEALVPTAQINVKQIQEAASAIEQHVEEKTIDEVKAQVADPKPIAELEFDLPKLNEEPKEEELPKLEETIQLEEKPKEELNFHELPEVNYLSELMEISPSQIFPDSEPQEEPKRVIDIFEDINTKTTKKELQEKIEKLNELKINNNLEEYTKVAEEIKNITSESNEEISKLAYEHELAAKASYLEFLNDNFDKLKDLIENMEDK